MVAFLTNKTSMEHLSSFATYELERTDCFLCRPAVRLLVDVAPKFFTIAGIGPLSPGYAIVATIEHLDKIRDATTIQQFSDYTGKIRQILTNQFGSCLLTEHGHSPLCTLADTKNVHCFHPHVLLFPGAPSILDSADECFSDGGTTFSTLAAALKFGVALPQYLLISESTSSFKVYPVAEGLPRQFARVLVAEQQGNEELASWRTHPGFDMAEKNAHQIKVLLRGEE